MGLESEARISGADRRFSRMLLLLGGAATLNADAPLTRHARSGKIISECRIILSVRL